MPDPPCRRSGRGCPKPAATRCSTVFRTAGSRCVRARCPCRSPRHAHCPDDPLGNSVPPGFPLSPQCVRRRTTYTRRLRSLGNLRRNDMRKNLCMRDLYPRLSWLTASCHPKDKNIWRQSYRYSFRFLPNKKGYNCNPHTCCYSPVK